MHQQKKGLNHLLLKANQSIHCGFFQGKPGVVPLTESPGDVVLRLLLSGAGEDLCRRTTFDQTSLEEECCLVTDT